MYVLTQSFPQVLISKHDGSLDVVRIVLGHERLVVEKISIKTFSKKRKFLWTND